MNTLYGFAASGIVPLRKEGRDGAEMVTQLLLGETFEVVSILDRWVEIIATDDGYPGWVNRNQIKFLTEDELQSWTKDPDRKRSPFATHRVLHDHEALMVPLGSYVIIKEEKGIVELPGKSLEMIQEPETLKGNTWMETALSLLGVPYIWGGRSDVGLDCSGYIQLLFQLFDMLPQRDSSKQLNRTVARRVEGDIIETAQRSDLVFFGPDEDTITHIGIYMGDGTLLHASGNVKLNNLSYAMRYQNKHPYDEDLANKILFVHAAEDIGQKEYTIPDAV